MREFMQRTEIPGSSRALGWDTMLPTSSCGRLMSASAIGHTGFTGTSLWVDWERDVYIVLLTNRKFADHAPAAGVPAAPAAAKH
jgi:CubicO group peptidase (beta-lactamase class C family)